MKSKEFVESLKRLMPTVYELKNYGLMADDINDIQRCFVAEPVQVADSLEFKSPIHELLACYSCSSLEIAGVSWKRKIIAMANGDCFASMELDPIVVEHQSGRILLLNHATMEFDAGTMVCASGSEEFLDAMIEVATIYRQKDRWRGRIDEATVRCVGKACASASEQFFSSLLFTACRI
ncbi:hypothetical protein [Neorhodopirellula pilleata]|uniref:Uncharacterized protein n=1 Tax=Neorhodopirellula pilleata TaxID=2714738 RepID=A0A5C5ZWG4_9BACT|nr:hypothetical protein [Neorhodopirellula pilleata]TWT91341.1 hypothetical protein Pla100_51890 [Neorhodopirellula pilleata]